MKKYILKIASLAITTTALVTTIACSDKPESKKQEKISLEPLLTQLKDVQSTQTKSQITTILGDKKTKNTLLDVTILKSIGFTTPPSFLKLGITATYTLVEDWTDSSTKLKIKVTLKRSGTVNTKSKIIIIKPKLKVIDFLTEKNRFVSQKSDKTKAEISSALSGKPANTQLSDDTLGQIGFKLPNGFDSTFKPSYTLEEAWTAASTKVRLKVILVKQGEKSKGKIIEISPLEINFQPELDKFSPRYTSTTKTRKEIIEALVAKPVNSNLADLTDVGYSPPGLSPGFTATYKLTKVPTDADPTVTIQVALEKRGDKATKVITITPMTIDFSAELAKFVNKTSSKTKAEIINDLGGKPVDSNLADLTDVGYSPPPVFDSSFTATYKLRKVPADADPKVTIQVTLTKQLMTATKEIEITPKTIDFTSELLKFQSKLSSKTKKEITDALRVKSQNLATVADVGYNPPTLTLGFTATYEITKVPTDADPTVTIQVTLEKKGDKDSKNIIITPIYDFTAVKDQVKDTQPSKSKRDIEEVLRGKSVGSIITATEMNSMGYTPPTLLNGVTIKKYEWKSDWQTTDTNTNMNKIKVTVILEKEVNSATTLIDTKDIWIKAYDFTAAKDLIKNVDSSKIKIVLQRELKDKIKNDNLTKELIGIGDKEQLLPNGVTITQYVLYEAMIDGTETFKVEAFLQKDTGVATKTDTQIMTIKAKPFNLTDAIELIPTQAISTKTKDKISLPTGPPTDDTVLNPANIGYILPITLPSNVQVEYKLINKESWAKDEDFLIEISFKFNNDKVSKQVVVIAKYNFDKAKELIPSEGVSTKIKSEFPNPLPKPGTYITKSSVLGYKPSQSLTSLLDKMNSFKIVWERGWGTTNNDKNKFQIAFILEKNSQKSRHVFTLKAKSELVGVLKEFPSLVNSRKKKSDFPNPLPTTGTIRQPIGHTIGYTPPLLPGVTIKEYKWKKGWGVDSNDHTFSIELTLQKGDETTTKIIKIKAQRQIFIPEKK